MRVFNVEKYITYAGEPVPCVSFEELNRIKSDKGVGSVLFVGITYVRDEEYACFSVLPSLWMEQSVSVCVKFG